LRRAIPILIAAALAPEVAIGEQMATEPSAALEEAQISALTTGNVESLEEVSAFDSVGHLTKEWTVLAVKQLHESHPAVSRESALLTSDFIHRGARTFIGEGARRTGRAKPRPTFGNSFKRC
jgi:hypothetical protein